MILILLLICLCLAPAFADPELDERIRVEPPLEPVKMSPYVSEDPFPLVEPPVRRLRDRLTLVKRMVQARGIPLHYVFQGLYGSGFLPLNPVGNDLDFAVGVHLGRVKNADEILARIESFLQAVEHVFYQQEAPEMAVLRFRLLKDGKLKEREKLEKRLADSLRDVFAGKPHVVLVDSLYGLRVPSVLSPDESYVYETTRIELLSNQVRSTDWMTPGIRGFQVMFHFYCDLEVGGRVKRNFPIHPTFVPGGKILKLEDEPLGMVPIDAESASFLTRLLEGRVVDLRLEKATGLLYEVNRTLAEGDSLKALKRLYQAANHLGPALPPDYFRRLHGSVGRALSDGDLQLANEIGTLAEMSRKALERITPLADYIDSFDFQRVLISLSRGMRRLARRHPGRWDAEVLALETRLRALQPKLREGFPDKATRDATRALLKDIETFSGKALEAFLPPLDEVKALRQEVADRIARAGLRPLEVYGMPDGTLGVLQGPVDGLVARGAPPFTYRVITEAEIPRDNRGNPVMASAVLWLRAGSSEELRQAIASEELPRFSAIESWQLRERGMSELEGRLGRLAWDPTATGYEGWLAVGGVPSDEEARQLLRNQLQATVAAREAARLFPGEPRVGLERALLTTSERILQGLAVGRASGGRRGLTVAQALEAQAQLALLLQLMRELPQARLEPDTDPEENEQGYIAVCPSGRLRLFVRSQTRPGKQARISLTPIARDSVNLRLDYSQSTGAGFDVQFADPQLDWGVHGEMPGNPMVSDHHFFDGLPTEWRRPQGPRDRALLAQSFQAYLTEEFVPKVLARLPGYRAP